MKQELSYDAWGRLRNPVTQVAYTPGSEPALFLGRGYTGHEHLPWFGLINMNARLYDAALGRFLAPDPYIQNPLFSQNYNRYSYALNNPLVYIDQDGEFWEWIVAGAILLGKMHYDGYKANNKEPNPTKWDWKNANYTVSVGNNTGPAGGVGGSVGVGWNNGYTTNVGYNQNSGFGMGYGVNGNNNMYYPSYDYNKPEKGAMAAINESRNTYNNFLSYSSSIGAAYAGSHYTDNNFARTGYFKTSNGTIRSLTDLEKQPNGKYLKGVQGMRISAEGAKYSVNHLSKVAKLGGHVSTLYSTYSFAANPNFEDGINASVGFGSMVFWEIGVFYMSADLMIRATSGERTQIKQNINENKNPMRGI